MEIEATILVACIPSRQDWELVWTEGWYRIPYQRVPKGLYADYIAFYFGRPFGDKKWAIHYYAANLGHELVQRDDLFLQGGKGTEVYYKVQLGEIVSLAEPIVSLRWRRISFFHTTGDRFLEAREINDLLLDGGDYLDRHFLTLD